MRGWSFTDRYWATALLPNTDAHLTRRSKRSRNAEEVSGQIPALDAQIIPPGGSGSADTRLSLALKKLQPWTAITQAFT
jgi:hypothetical protein